MSRQKVAYIFHNPNSTGRTVKALLRVFRESNEKKLEKAIVNAQLQASYINIKRT